MKTSVLEEIEGVGPKTAKKLLKTFKTLHAIRQADEKMLQKAGVSVKLAARIYSYFHK